MKLYLVGSAGLMVTMHQLVGQAGAVQLTAEGMSFGCESAIDIEDINPTTLA